MIVAGFGYGSGAALVDFESLLDDLTANVAGKVERLAIPSKSEAGPLAELSSKLGVERVLIDKAQMRSVAALCATSSARSLQAYGVPSVAEACALAAAGANAKLLVARNVRGKVTCALAEGEG